MNQGHNVSMRWDTNPQTKQYHYIMNHEQIHLMITNDQSSMINYQSINHNSLTCGWLGHWLVLMSQVEWLDCIWNLVCKLCKLQFDWLIDWFEPRIGSVLFYCDSVWTVFFVLMIDDRLSFVVGGWVCLWRSHSNGSVHWVCGRLPQCESVQHWPDDPSNCATAKPGVVAEEEPTPAWERGSFDSGASGLPFSLGRSGNDRGKFPGPCRQFVSLCWF